MAKTKILVVEDERIVALDIQGQLENLGYTIAAAVSSGEEAVRKAAELRPDLALMDIRLRGVMDGVETAEQLRQRFDVPVIYLTAHADDHTLDRAKVTEPFGYLLKPFEERELHSAIQMALHKHRMERQLRESEARFRSLIENASDIVLVSDGDGIIRYVGPSIQRVLGYAPDTLMAKNLFGFLHPDDVSRLRAGFSLLLQRPADFSSGEGRFRHGDGTWRTLEFTGRNLLEDPVVQGVVVNARDVTERKRVEDDIRERERFLALLSEITRAALETPDLTAMLQTLADRLGEVIGADGCYITLWDETTQRAVPAVVHTQARDTNAGPESEPAERAVTESVMNSGTPLVIDDVLNTPHLRKSIAEMLRDRALLVLPLLAGDRKLGAALLAFIEPHKFTTDEIARGEQAARQVALALAKARLIETEREHRLQAETLTEVTQVLTAQIHHGAVLDEILHQAQRIVPHSTANIALLDEGVLRVVRWHGYQDYDPEWEETIPGIGQPLVDWPIDAEVVRSKEPRIIVDTRREANWQEHTATGWIRSYLAVPICLRDRVLGLLRLDSDVTGHFSAEDAQKLIPLASAAAIAIGNARLFAEARQRVDELETLRHTGLQITSLLELPVVLDTISESALSLVGGSDCHIYLYDAGSDSFTFGAALWSNGRREPAVKAPRPEGFTATVAHEGQVIVINDAVHHPLFTTPEARPWKVQAIAGFPLKRGGTVVGVFTVAFLEPHRFSEDELRVLDLLADQAVIAIENARLVQGLEAEVVARTAEIVAEQEKSEAILRSVGDAIMMADQEMRIRYVNPAFSAMTGYTVEEVLGQPAGSVGARPDSEQMEQFIQRSLEAGEVWEGEMATYRKDGRTYDAALTIAPLRDADGRPVGFVSSHRDISRIKRLERARTQFMTNVSHELRTPVSNIKLYAKLLRTGKRPEKIARYIEVLEDQADQLSHLIQDILDVTALDSGQAVTEWKSISVSTVIEDTIARYEAQAKAAGLKLSAAPAPGPTNVVKGDLSLLVQALGELIENAVTFTPSGGQVVVEEGIIREAGQKWAVVSVRDTGPGISAEEQERVFDRFYRGGLAESGHVAGTGLGLSIVQEIMRAHGGRVTVDSALDVGSSFTLWLPFALD